MGYGVWGSVMLLGRVLDDLIPRYYCAIGGCWFSSYTTFLSHRSTTYRYQAALVKMETGGIIITVDRTFG